MEDNEDSFLYGNTTHENITSSDQQIASQIQTEPTEHHVDDSQIAAENERKGEEDDEEAEEEEEDDFQIVLNPDTVEKAGSFPKAVFYRSSGAKQAAQKFGSPSFSSVQGQSGQSQTPKSMQAQNAVTGPNLLVQPQSGPSPIVAQNQRNVFDLDIDTLEEKPWRKPGVDITDYFNYGFNEDTWRQYCGKQVQLRLEQSMQGKIKVYESKQADQKQDLPAELLALTDSDKKRKPPPRRYGRESTPEWSRPSSSYEHTRRRVAREQDDSVIQVLASGEDTAAATKERSSSPSKGSPSRPESPRKHDKGYRKDEKYDDRRDDRKDYRSSRDDDRRREERKDDKRSSDRSRDDRSRSRSPSHKRSRESSKDYKREEDDRSKRRR